MKFDEINSLTDEEITQLYTNAIIDTSNEAYVYCSSLASGDKYHYGQGYQDGGTCSSLGRNIDRQYCEYTCKVIVGNTNVGYCQTNCWCTKYNSDAANYSACPN